MANDLADLDLGLDSSLGIKTIEQESQDREDSLEGVDGFDPDSLTLNGIDVDSLELDGAQEVENYTNITEPHFIFDTKDIYNRLQPLGIIVKDSSDLYAKVVHIEAVADKVRFSVNTGDCVCSVMAPLENKTNVLGGTYIVDFKPLLTVIRQSGSKVLFMGSGDTFKIRVLGGEVDFEKYTLDEAIIKKAAEFDKTVKRNSIAHNRIHSFVHNAACSLSLSARAEDRKVRVEGGVGYANYLSSVVKFGNTGLGDVSFRGMDLVFLMKILEGTQVVSYGFDDANKYHVVGAGPYVYAFPEVQTTELKTVVPIFENLQAKMSISVAPAHLHKVLLLIKGIIGNSGIVNLASDNGALVLKASTQAGRQLSFPLSQVASTEKVEIKIPLQPFFSMAVLYKSQPTITATIESGNKLILNSDDMEVIFGSIIQ